MSAPRNREIALVTGASSGIGAALARQFAQSDFDLILVARRTHRLQALADELEHTQGTRSHVITADLSDSDAPEHLFNEVQRLGVQVSALVNDAGCGIPGPFGQSSWNRQQNGLQVMSVAPAHLAYLFTPGMVERGRGWVINVSSLAAFLPPHSGGTIYYPVKAFLLKLSLALHEELRKSGVHVTALCPGFTRTEFQQAAGGTVESVSPPSFMWMTSEAVARAGFRAVMRGEPCCIPGFVNNVIATVFKLMPDALGRSLIRALG